MLVVVLVVGLLELLLLLGLKLLLAEHLVEFFLSGEGRRPDDIAGSAGAAGTDGAVVGAGVGAKVARVRAIRVRADGAVLAVVAPSAQRALADGGLEHVAVCAVATAVAGLGVRPALSGNGGHGTVALLELAQEAAAAALADADDAEAGEGEKKGDAAKGNADAGAERDWAVVGGRDGGEGGFRGDDFDGLGVVEGVAADGDCGAGSGSLLAGCFEDYHVVVEVHAAIGERLEAW